MRATPTMAALLLGTTIAHPRPLPLPQPVVPQVPIVSQCWFEPRWFYTLRDGNIDYCRQHLRFRPGRPECMAFTDQVCWALFPDTGEWTQLRSNGEQHVIICPDGPEPPTCPRMR